MNAIPTHFSVAGDALTSGSAGVGVGGAAQRLEFTVTSAAVLEEELDQRTPITATMRFMGADGRAVQVFAYSRR